MVFKMREKISAKIFILLASALLVAHAVIPHLHYKNQVFIITPTCSSDENHKHNAPEHNDENEKSQHYCLLKQVVLMRLDEVKSETINTATDTNNNFNNTPCCILSVTNDFHFKTGLKISPPVVYKSSLYTRLSNFGVSSRGSPIV